MTSQVLRRRTQQSQLRPKSSHQQPPQPRPRNLKLPRITPRLPRNLPSSQTSVRSLFLGWARKRNPQLLAMRRQRHPSPHLPNSVLPLEIRQTRMEAMGNAMSKVGSVLTRDAAKSTTVSSSKVAATSDPASPATFKQYKRIIPLRQRLA